MKEEGAGRRGGEHVARTTSDYKVPVIGHLLYNSSICRLVVSVSGCVEVLNLTTQLYVAVLDATGELVSTFVR